MEQTGQAGVRGAQEFLLNIFRAASADRAGAAPAPMGSPSPTAAPAAAREFSRLSVNTNRADIV